MSLSTVDGDGLYRVIYGGKHGWVVPKADMKLSATTVAG
jgi:hypothetical protein